MQGDRGGLRGALEEQLLSDCYRRCMEEVLELAVSSVVVSEVGRTGVRYVSDSLFLQFPSLSLYSIL